MMNYKTVAAILTVAATASVAVLLYQEDWFKAAWVTGIAVVGIPGGLFAQACGRGFDS
jgi:hypothetical protein